MTPDSVVRHRKDMWKARLIGLGLLFLGLLAGVVPLSWAFYVSGWPTARATITSSHVSRNTDNDDYTVYVNYEYSVNDQTYTGSFNSPSGSRTSGYVDGSSVEVRYNPTIPWLSSRGEGEAAAVVGIVAGVCCLMPFGLIFVAFSFLPPQNPAHVPGGRLA